MTPGLAEGLGTAPGLASLILRDVEEVGGHAVSADWLHRCDSMQRFECKMLVQQPT